MTMRLATLPVLFAATFLLPSCRVRLPVGPPEATQAPLAVAEMEAVAPLAAPDVVAATPSEDALRLPGTLRYRPPIAPDRLLDAVRYRPRVGRGRASGFIFQVDTCLPSHD